MVILRETVAHLSISLSSQNIVTLSKSVTVIVKCIKIFNNFVLRFSLTLKQGTLHIFY